ncbi:hypothetical protein WDU94_001821 [Cyamophila willieti]
MVACKNTNIIDQSGVYEGEGGLRKKVRGAECEDGAGMMMGKVRDSRGKLVEYYPDVPEILSFLKKHKTNMQIAVASRSPDRMGANQLLDLLGWGQFIDHREIFPTVKDEKLSHFKNLRRHSGIDYRDMVFYDDIWKNNVEAAFLNVSCWTVKGLTRKNFIEGIKAWRECHVLMGNDDVSPYF